MKTLAIATIGLALAAPVYAGTGNQACPNALIPANEETLEAVGNTRDGTAYNVNGILVLSNPALETEILDKCNKNGKKCSSSVTLRPPATLVLTIRGGAEFVERTVTVDAGKSVAIPWLTVESGAFYSVTVTSDNPLNCAASDVTVSEAVNY